ncbi:hypothetical protein SAMN05192574_101354 [Mucilaginibacter gossypiicola]|uniref:Uncharacterized protein n=1 Tax=Mucilaginibacter gossypiicola TaxID=551995 RepID=A0A1H8A4A6_9SPHI|nr:hypothetical protein [Mucilaginibacter gossypiicola]SEM65585.1 hypothetical protein SAMN05192574_101354 [Mucilaginibacter gossypiicola]
MADDTKPKIPTEYLPENWRKLGAEKFDLSESTIGKVASGARNNDDVFDYLLDLAVKGKQKAAAAEANRQSLLEKLNA